MQGAVITMAPNQLEALLEDAAERGARKALAAVGLADDMAPNDIRGLRDLFGMYRVIRTGFLKQVGGIVAIFVLGAISVAIGAKIGIIKLP